MAVDLSMTGPCDDNNNSMDDAIDLSFNERNKNVPQESFDFSSVSDIHAVNLLCLAQLQETAALLQDTLKSGNLQNLAQLLHHSNLTKKSTVKKFKCDFPDCEKVSPPS